MKLTELVREFPFQYELINGDTEIAGLTSDSRLVQTGYLFIAVAGASTDGHNYITAALERGATAIVGTKLLTDLKAPYLRVNDSRMALPHLAAAFYEYPARKLTMIGGTGRDGK